MLIERGVVRVGMEIEVAKWDGNTYQAIAKRLINQGYMEGEPENWAEFHRYGCVCDLGCGTVRSGKVIDPPLVSITYDASLPNTGAEFVTSTVVVGPYGLKTLRPIWDTVVDRAVWTNKVKDRNGGWASPSIHLHVSANLAPDKNDKRDPHDLMNQADDCMHALSLFAPEFIALASAAGYKRGLNYRKPMRYADGGPRGGHHGFVHVRKFIPRQIVYIEWRMFEAAYDNWDYVESSAFLAASLTRALLDPGALSNIMAIGYSEPYDGGEINKAVRDDNTDGILKLVSPRRLEFLKDFCLRNLDDDDEGRKLVSLLFENTERNYG